MHKFVQKYLLKFRDNLFCEILYKTKQEYCNKSELSKIINYFYYLSQKSSYLYTVTLSFVLNATFYFLTWIVMFLIL